MGGRLDAYFLGLPGVTPQVKGGKVRLLAVTTTGRAGSAADTPTVAELGIPGYNFSLWGGFFAPVGTPAEIVTRINREVLQVLGQPAVKAQMAEQGSDVTRTTPQEFGRFVQSELKKYGEIVKGSGLKLE
jgi:tripartite-type tricarboxylate transporter receptor subunit TctC